RLFVCCSRLFRLLLYADHRDLHSFPTRRSSGLEVRIVEPRLVDVDEARADAGAGAAPARSQADVGAARFFAAGGIADVGWRRTRSEEHTSELQSRVDLVCRLLLEKQK